MTLHRRSSASHRRRATAGRSCARSSRCCRCGTRSPPGSTGSCSTTPTTAWAGARPWEHDLWWEDSEPEWLDEHAGLLQRLEVEITDGVVRWTEPQARAFQLLHILPHELGHHHDRMTTRTQRYAARGEPYAEAYAMRVLDEVWPAYLERFGA